ncbi:MAG: MFS transporter [Bacillota bacterium]|nr:MFS transporter [Bacillota bacterium]
MDIKPQQAVEEEIEVRPTLWTRDYILICLSSMFIFLAFHMYLPTLPVYMEKIGGMSELAGWPIAGLTLGAVLIRPLAGWALDTYGRKAILFGGILLFLLPSIIYIWMVPAMILVVLRIVQGLGWGIGNTASNTVASDIVPRKRLGEGMGFFTITLTLPLAISPAVGLWLIEEHSFSLMFAIAVLLIVISMLLLLFIKLPHFEKRTAKVALVFMEKAALRPAMIILALTITYSSVISFFPLYAFQQGVPATGLFFTALAVSTMVIRPLSGIIVDRMGKEGYNFVVLLGCIGLFISMIIIARVATVSQVILGGAIYGAGFGFLQPAMLALCLNSVPPEKRGAANATYWTAYDIGVAAGSVLWGPVAVALGYKTMFELTLVPVAIACFLYFMKKRSPESPVPGT